MKISLIFQCINLKYYLILLVEYLNNKNCDRNYIENTNTQITLITSGTSLKVNVGLNNLVYANDTTSTRLHMYQFQVSVACIFIHAMTNLKPVILVEFSNITLIHFFGVFTTKRAPDYWLKQKHREEWCLFLFNTVEIGSKVHISVAILQQLFQKFSEIKKNVTVELSKSSLLTIKFIFYKGCERLKLFAFFDESLCHFIVYTPPDT